MTRRIIGWWRAWGTVLILVAFRPLVAQEDLRAVEAIQMLGTEGAGHAEALPAMKRLSGSALTSLPTILEGMRDGHPLANNWLSGAAQSVVDRHVNHGGEAPVGELQDYVTDETHSVASRFLAFELLERIGPDTAKSLIPSMMNDPCLDLRRMAVAQTIEQANQLSVDKPDDALAVFEQALSSARDVDQVQEIADKMAELDVDVDLIKHFGFITRWHLVGPFDHSGSKRKTLDTPYPPEQVDSPRWDAEYPGKDGPIQWSDFETEDPLGNVDLNTAIAKHLGAIAYAFAEFYSAEEQDVELRLGCINANKVWLNGVLLTENEVYHTKTAIDQYVGRGRLKAGRNTILVKIAQNEQTESWAQRWQFQLRVCDALGTAVLSSK